MFLHKVGEAMSKTEDCLSVLEQAVNETASEGKSDIAAARGMSEEEILEKMARQMATAKKWATENDEVKQTKACLGELRTLVTDYKKENNKKEAQAKKLAKKKDGKAADKGDGHLVRPDTLDCVAWMAREMRKNEKVQNASSGLYFNIQKDVLDCMPGSGLVLIPADQLHPRAGLL